MGNAATPNSAAPSEAPPAGPQGVSGGDALNEQAVTGPISNAPAAVVPGAAQSSASPPESAAPAPSGGCAEQVVPFDALFQLVRADLATQPPDSARFLRYASLTNQLGAGGPLPADCDAALAQARSALLQGLNMLSLSEQIHLPTAINPEQTLYRIDLRDYAWDRNLDFEGRSYSNVWEAIAAQDRFAVPFIGTDADAIQLASGATVPILFADQLLSTASAGTLYYSILGVDPSAAFADFVREGLGIDLQGNLQAGLSVRAGTAQPGVAGQRLHLLQRDEMRSRSGVLWQSFELDSEATSFTIAQLTALPATGGEAIFTLPNGMLGFLIFDARGTLATDSDVLIDMNLNSFRAAIAVSCSNCHHGGFLSATDQALDFALSNALDLGLDRDAVAQLQSLYAPDQFARAVAQDMEKYRAALDETGASGAGNDPVFNLFVRFQRDLQLSDAARELGVSQEALRASLPQLSPVLSALGSGTLDRDDFAAVFADSLCQLSASHVNRARGTTCSPR